jgi:PAS domain S-box-containing protein
MKPSAGNHIPDRVPSTQDQSVNFQNIFHHSPIPLWVEDFSAIKLLFDQSRANGVLDFRAHFEAHPEEVRRCASLLKISQANQASLDFFKARSMGEMPADLSAYFREDSWTVFREEMIALANGALRFETNIPIVDLAGHRRIVHLALVVPPDFAADLACVLVSFTDITERERLHEALRASEERFRTVLSNVPAIAVQGYNADGNVTYWNEASTRLYGYPREEAMGHNLTSLIIPPAMRTAVRAAMKQMVETLHPIPAGQLDLMRKDGTTVTVFSSHTVMNIPGQGFELYCLDIDLSDLKRAETRLNEQLDELRRWHDITLGREMRILDLKREVNGLLSKAGLPPRYASAEADPSLEDPAHA